MGKETQGERERERERWGKGQTVKRGIEKLKKSKRARSKVGGKIGMQREGGREGGRRQLTDERGVGH